MSSLKFGCHDFLNAQPLLRNLRKQACDIDLEIHTGSPGELADLLKEGDLDFAMIPSYEYLKRINQYRLLPGVCIASKGKVDSVFLVSKEKDLLQVRSVAADCRSRTSIAVLKILFGERFHKDWEIISTEPDLELMLENNSAALIIGDAALEINRSKPYTVLDLSEEWLARTGKPFVHAVIAIREGAEIPGKTVTAIQNATRKDHGLVESVCRDYAKGTEEKFSLCKDYLIGKINYRLGPEEIEGMKEFQKMCANIDNDMPQSEYIWERS